MGHTEIFQLFLRGLCVRFASLKNMGSECVHTSKLALLLGELIAPTRCAGCERQSGLFCRRCRASLTKHFAQTQVCPRCAAPYGALTCTECWDQTFSFSAAVALGILDGPLARAVVLYKDANEQRLADIFGPPLARRAQRSWKAGFAEAVTWIPASRRAIARRGFDHAELLARAVAAELQLPTRALLKRPWARDQRGLSRRERLKASSAAAFSCTQLPPAPLLLVDDVMTTGATADAAAVALLKAGAARVSLAVIARAW
jgi:predicted amidophosphoribosyltransferase